MAGKTWKKADLNYLERYAQSKRLEELAQRFDTDVASVQHKLKELGLTAKDWSSAGESGPDPFLGVYEEALKSLYRKNWSAAEKKLRQITAECDQPELVDRAQQFLALCQRKASEDTPGAGEDPFLDAVVHKNRGELETALDLCRRGSGKRRDERFVYLEASILALLDRHAEAARCLSQAIELNPKNRVHAYHDSDFASLRESPDHAHLFSVP